jgi:hypothetical protein
MRHPAIPRLLVVTVLLTFPAALLATPQQPPVTSPRAPEPPEPAAGSGWSDRAREVVEETTRRHVQALERLAHRLPNASRPEVSRVRDAAAMARESAARAFRSSSRNEMMQARTQVRDAFRQSRTSLDRLSTEVDSGDAREVRAVLERIAAQQARALQAFDSVLGLPREEATSNPAPPR